MQIVVDCLSRQALGASCPGLSRSQHIVQFEPVRGRALDASAHLLSQSVHGDATWRIEVICADDPAKTPIAEVTILRHAGPATDDASHTEPDEDPRPDLGHGRTSPVGDGLDTRRRKIFEGACRVIGRRSFGNATMREIAEEAGMSVPLMYKYIRDKDGILELITRECMQHIIDYFRDKIETDDPTVDMRAAISAYIDYIDQNRRYINLVYSETRSMDRALRQKIFDLELQFMNYWRSIIERGVQTGSFRPVDADLYANIIYFTCTVWSLRYWSIGSHSTEVIRAELCEFVLNGLSPRG